MNSTRPHISSVSIFGLILPTVACSPFADGDVDWANRQEIVEAAKACGLADFAPTKVGEAWAAYVPEGTVNGAEIEDCIYANLEAKELVATR